MMELAEMIRRAEVIAREMIARGVPGALGDGGKGILFVAKRNTDRISIGFTHEETGAKVLLLLNGNTGEFICELSIGHAAVIADVEYFYDEVGALWSAPISNPIDLTGRRSDARFEAVAAQARQKLMTIAQRAS